MKNKFRVLIDCKDEIGLVYKISQVFYQLRLNIDNNQEFVDKENAWFFMRTVLSGVFDAPSLKQNLQSVLPQACSINIIEPKKKKIVLMVTKESHCLGDILLRHFDSEIEADIVGVISNHPDLETLVEKFNLPYFWASTENIGQAEHELKIIDFLNSINFDYVVLAKYMRILSQNFVEAYKNKILNIHHSFLPSFVGANPYKQAYDRGVKTIGATAHFVTANLDAGPIIVQDVIDISHRDTWQDMQCSGKDVEKIVLARALKLVLADRVFVNGNKTIVL